MSCSAISPPVLPSLPTDWDLSVIHTPVSRHLNALSVSRTLNSPECAALTAVLCPHGAAGVEHHLPQLADVRAVDLVLHSLDDTQQEEIRHDQLSFHGCLCQSAAGTAVHMEL